MSAFLYRNKDYLVYLGLMMIVLGLPLSRVMIVIGYIIIIALWLLQKHAIKNILPVFRNPPFMLFYAFVTLALLSLLWSSDNDFSKKVLLTKLPLLLFPISLYALCPVKREPYLILLSTFLFTIFGCAVFSLFHFFVNYSNVVDAYTFGKVMFTPVNHTRFSLMVVMALIITYYFLKNNLVDSRIFQILLGIVMVFLIVYLHVLSVRSGLLAFYTVVLVFGLKHIFETKKYYHFFGLLLVSMILFFAALNLSPTLQSKYSYMKYELENYAKGNRSIIGSDIRRLLSIEVAAAVGNDNFWLGVGNGNLKKKTEEKYAQLYPDVPDENRKLPHNQLVYVYASLGIVGVLLLLSFYFSFVFYSKSYNDTIILGISTIVFTSFLSEHLLEEQVGIAFYMLFLFVPYCNQLKTLKPVQNN